MFRSKIGVVYIAVLLLLLVRWLLPATQALASGRSVSPLPLALPLLAIGALVYLARTTRYIVTDDALIVRCGPFAHQVPLSGVYKIRATWNPLSAPALSMDRLEVLSQQRGPVLISPADRAGLVAAIRARNPAVAVEGVDPA